MDMWARLCAPLYTPTQTTARFHPNQQTDRRSLLLSYKSVTSSNPVGQGQCMADNGLSCVFFFVTLMLLKGHGGRHACPYCEGIKSLVCGRMRTFGLLKQRYQAYVANGSKLKSAKNFANVINPSLFQYEDSDLVLFKVPPPPLHLLIGGVDVIMSLIIQLKGKKISAIFSYFYGQDFAFQGLRRA